MMTYINGISVLIVLVLSACGGSGDKKIEVVPDPVTPIPGDTEPTAGLLKLTPLVDVEDAYNSDIGEMTSLKKVITLTNNRLLILGETSPIAINGNQEGFIAITDQQGATYSFEQSKTGYADACVHASGEYSVGKFMPSDLDNSPDKHTMQIQRFAIDGSLVQSTMLSALVIEDRYNIPVDKAQWLLEPFTIENADTTEEDGLYRQSSLSWGHFDFVKFHCNNEELLVTYNNGGQKLAKYSADLQLQWQKVVSIYYWGNSTRSATTLNVAVTDDGDIFVVDDISTDAIPAYNHRFSSTLPLVENKGQSERHIILKRFNGDGEMLEEKLYVSEHSQLVRGLTIKDHQVIVGTVSRIDKVGKSQYSSEWDIGLLQVNSTDMSSQQMWFDLDKEDILNGIKSTSDGIYLYGHTGGVQVDTNSWVGDSKGFYAKYDIENQQLTPTMFKASRSSEVNHLVISGGKLNAVGITNGPITHSSDLTQQGLFIETSLIQD